MEISLNAQVECIDGVCGRITYMLINPVIDKVVYLVVKEVGAPCAEYIVPIDLVDITNTNTILLDCTKAELVEMEAWLQVEIRITYLEAYNGIPLNDVLINPMNVQL